MPNEMSGGVPALTIEALSVAFPAANGEGEIHPVDGISLSLFRGATLGLVGESGCGKSLAALSILGLIPPPGRLAGGAIRLAGTELTSLDERAMNRLRGGRIAMIFQEPMTALNPVVPVGAQIAEMFLLHPERGDRTIHGADRRRQAIALMERVGIANAAARAGDHPHQFSGGQRQRLMIAMAIACRPEVLIADEPTTALDVTVQAQILTLIRDLQDEMGMAVLFITHNLGLIAEIAEEVAVMYGGRIIEKAPASTLFAAPRHPYTRALLASLPRLGAPQGKLATIPGRVPGPGEMPSGCRFRDRCAEAIADCAAIDPPLKPVSHDTGAAAPVAEGKTGFAACIRVP